mmetsp:Transcript_12214/g.23206  ORF Transcript_12214/g.23206 Transcript_12214/m.23206 type:complete len:80 (-) Transcript_12214:213-452(-)
MPGMVGEVAEGSSPEGVGEGALLLQILLPIRATDWEERTVIHALVIVKSPQVLRLHGPMLGALVFGRGCESSLQEMTIN